MKYVHDGKTYVIFTAFDDMTHANVAFFLKNNKAKHAGFVSFKNDDQTKAAEVYGHSTGLNLTAAPFDYDEVNYVGFSRSDFIMISNSKKVLEDIGCKDIEVAVWKESREGDYGECPVIYPGHPTGRNMKACKLLRR